MTISSLTLISSGTLSDTAVPGVFGELSGITYNEATNTYLVISDAGNNPSFYTVQIAIDTVANTVTPSHLNGIETPTLLNISGGFTAPDLEGIALDNSGNIFVSSEGAYTALNPLAIDSSVLTETPFIKRLNSSGTDLLTLALPSRFTTSTSTQGPRNNAALESLTLTPNNNYLFTAVEGPLKQDQSLSFLPAPFGANAPPLNRLVRFDFSGGVLANVPSQEFLYIGDPGYGLGELLAIDNSGQRLLSIERSANTSGVITGVKVFEVSLAGATDISGNAGLGGSINGITSVTKTLLADFSTPPLSGLLTNYEGITFGPLLPDGRRSLVLVSDNNSSGASRFTVFAVNETPTLVTIAALDANAAEAGQNPGTFRISRTGDATNALTVNYTIATGTGQATNGDYTPALTGSATIPIGQTFVDITITPIDDAIAEGSETITLNLTDGATYNLGATTSATVTITDNDLAPNVNLSVSSNTGNEAGQTVITVTATTSAPVSSPQTVNLAVTGLGITTGDYTLSSTSIAIANGQTNGAVTFTIQDDSIIEGPETATIAIGAISAGLTLGGTISQNITIADNDIPNVARVDFNSDGNTDILWRNVTTGDVAIWTLDGASILQTPLLGNVPISSGWQPVGAGDFTNDGKTDILWRNYNTGDNGVWEMDGTTLVTAKVINPVSKDSGWDVVGVGDFTNDGKTDILWRNYNTGDNGIWEMNGTTFVTARSIINVDPRSNWDVVGVGDFSDDGNLDILWRNRVSGENAYWEMQGNTLLRVQIIETVPINSGWQIAGVDDFTNDGRPDILWQNTLGGQVGVWVMNGSARTGILNLTATGAPPIDWRIV